MTREEAISMIKDDIRLHHEYLSGKYRKALRVAISALEQPEIIHCRDCKHWSEGDAYSYCNKLFNAGVLDVYDYMTAEDDFCSYAERRKE